MLKVHTSQYALSEEEMNRMGQKDGLTLISVNHVLTHEYPKWSGLGESGPIVRWTYHFRATGKTNEVR